MTIQQIRYCLGVADCGSFNKASEKLYISQPSLTSSIHDLEDELGFEIFKRTSRGTTATDKGESFLLDARVLYNNYDELVKKYITPSKKRFSVSALYYEFARHAFIEVVNSYPSNQYDFSFREMRALSVIEDVSDGKSDIGILYLSDKNREEITKAITVNKLKFTHLIECGAFVYIHKKHPLAKKEWISLEDLKPYHFITFDTDDVKSFFSDKIIEEYNLNQPITVADRSTELNLLQKLNGFTFLSGVSSEIFKQNKIETDDFVTIPLKNIDNNMSHNFSLGYITKKDKKTEQITNHYISAVKSILNLE
ncbi:MAG: LysR family transcriptional regulator [Treponema sp.]|nr:LysR family transcriptional regulator [Treponema sp.]